MEKDIDSVSENTVLDITGRKADGTCDNYVEKRLIICTVDRMINL